MPATSRRALGFAVLLPLMALVTLSAASGDFRLVNAVKNRDAQATRTLLAQHADVNVAEPDGATPLHWAAHWDDVAVADKLLAAGAKVDAANDYGVTPLSMAAQNGSAAMVERLLKAGANVEGALPTGETPLMIAARTGKVEATLFVGERNEQQCARAASSEPGRCPLLTLCLRRPGRSSCNRFRRQPAATAAAHRVWYRGYRRAACC